MADQVDLDRPRSVSAARSAARRRSMVGGDITTNAAATSSLTSSSPQRRCRDQAAHHRREPLPRRRGQHRPVEPQRDNDVRPVDGGPRPARTHHPRPQRLPQGRARMVAMPARRRAQLVEDRALLDPARPLVPRSGRLVTACRWLIVSPIPRAYRRSLHPHRKRALPAHSPDESTTPPRRASLMSQRAALTIGRTYLARRSLRKSRGRRRAVRAAAGQPHACWRSLPSMRAVAVPQNSLSITRAGVRRPGEAFPGRSGATGASHTPRPCSADGWSPRIIV